MVRYATALMTGLLSAGCAVMSPRPPDLPAPEAIVVVTDNPIGAPEPLDPQAQWDGACELLLDQLEQSQALLAGLDDRLERHAQRVETSVKTLAPPTAQPLLDCPRPESGLAEGKELIGALEWLFMEPPGRHYRARVDSGAETSSISASDVVEFERDGDNWVRFTFQHDSPEQSIEFELPVLRTALIRQPSVRDPERRVVVEIDIRLGDQLQTTEFNLADRSEMTYPVLLGRAFLMDLYVVDVSRSYTHKRYQPAGDAQ